MAFKFDLFKTQKKLQGNVQNPLVLLVLDGFGIAPDSYGNAISRAKTPNLDSYKSTYPYGELIASGEMVGLPANEDGNSEVGHLTLGVGRVVLQSLMRINKSIEDGSFFDNKAFWQATQHVKKANSKLHLIGLASSGHVHASLDHLFALLDFCRQKSIARVCLHLFTDGRDTAPKEAEEVIGDIQNRIKDNKGTQIATISGRYYAMDRDMHWERTQKVYEALTLGKGVIVKTPLEAVKFAYAKNLTDEFIEPTVIVQGDSALTIDDNDAVIFFNFRIDRPRQLTMAFVLPSFETLKFFEFDWDPYREEGVGMIKKDKNIGEVFIRQKKPQNLFFVTMTEYQKNLPVSGIAYPNFLVAESFPEVLAAHKMHSLHLSESEKERMVTYYFRGMREEPFLGEDIKIIDSPRVGTYDKKPEMSIDKIVDFFKEQLRRNYYSFFVINFANPDMVAHTGNLEATIKAIEIVDQAVGEVAEEILKVNGTLVITADHGNAEELITFPKTSYFFTSEKGTINTDHSNNPVPIFIINKYFYGKTNWKIKGVLADVAPTLCALLNIRKPAVMTGKNLLQ